MATLSSGNRFSPVSADDHAGSLWIAALLCMVYSVLVVAVRAHLRRKLYGIDDYLIFGATLLQLGEVIAIVVGLNHGIGKTIPLLHVADVSIASQTTFASQILFIVAAALAKCSTLYLMMRLFNLNGPKSHSTGRPKVYWLICMSLLAAMALWCVVSIVGLSVDCSTDNFIRAAGNAQCPNQVLRWQLITTFDVATEALLIIMAVVIVLPVQLTFELKFQVVLAFLFRLPLIALSILRLHYVQDFTEASNTGLALVPILILQQVYICWSIISATIPNLKSFVRSFGSGFGIGVDMETYTNAYGSKNSARNAYELGSVKTNTLGSRQTASRHDNRSYNDVEHQGSLPQMRTEGKKVHKNHDGSTGSADSQQHIIRKDVQWKIHYENGKSKI